MDTVVFKPSIVETWLDLLQEAQNDTAHELDQDVLSYLVLLLIRFTDDPALATSVLALEYLQSQHLEGRLQRHCLREVGDKCLLYSGLFPKRARRRRVRVSYYVDLGRSAYQTLAEGIGRDGGLTYGQLAATFVPLMEVLQAMRRVDDPAHRLDAIEAYDLWADTGSPRARTELSRHSKGLPCATVRGGETH